MNTTDLEQRGRRTRTGPAGQNRAGSGCTTPRQVDEGPGRRPTQPAESVDDADVIDRWDRAAEAFAELFTVDEEVYHRQIIAPCLMELLGDLGGKTVLDLACGDGHLARWLVQEAQGRVSVVGLDASRRMIEIAQARSRGLGDSLTFRHADVTEQSALPREAFDIAICNMALMDIKDYAAAIDAVARALKPRGTFVFSILHPCFHTLGSSWARDEEGNIVGWRVGDYYANLAWRWTLGSALKQRVYCFHRTLTDYVTTVLRAGFAIAELREPVPSEELLERHPRFARELMRADFLVVKCMLADAETRVHP